MTLPKPSPSSRGAQFRVLGVPVRIDPLFVVVMALLGYASLPGGFDLARIIVWIVVGGVSVVAHELGHALVARTTGARPAITLYGMGGVTVFRPPRPMSRARSLAISACGPLVGLVIGGALKFGVPSDVFAPGSLPDFALGAAIWVNLGWGLLNLLPILPLDGGNLLVELLPGVPAVRRRRAAMVSIATAIVAGVVAWRIGYVYAAALAAWFAVDNIGYVTPARRPPAQTPASPPPPSPAPSLPPFAAAGLPRQGDLDRTVLWLLDQGRVREAEHMVDTLPAGATIDDAVRGLVLAVTGFAGRGRDLALEALRERPTDPVTVGAFARLLAHRREWSALADLASGPVRDLVPGGLLTWAATQARAQGASFEADRLARLSAGTPAG